MLSLLLIACTAQSPFGVDSAPLDSSAPNGTHTTLPEHSACLPEGQVMSDEVCLAVVEEDGRYPTVSRDKSGSPGRLGDPRLEDPDYLWLASEIERCTCVCCHRTRYDGPGVYLWDMDFEPVWIDSMGSWSMGVFGGWTDEAAQTLPSQDLDRVREVLDRERARRRN